MGNTSGIKGAFFLAASLILGAGSFLSQGCGDKSPAGPVTVVATPVPGTLAGRDWNFATLSADFSRRGYLGTVVFKNRMWVLGGYGDGLNFNDVWSSSNGSSWRQELADNASPGSSQFSQRAGFGFLTFNNKIWVIGGEGSSNALNDVWSSTDGVVWTQVLADNASPGSSQFSRRRNFPAIVFDNKMWIIGGDGSTNALNDVWSSTDGTTWTRVLSYTASPGSSQFSARNQLMALAYGGKMWVLGGLDNGGYLNDSWYSADGITWIQARPNQAAGPDQFSGRFGLQALVYGNAMWVIGGATNSGPANDVWYSADGATWTPMTSAAPFTPRYQFASLVFNNAMWVIGGASAGPFLNDVWYSPF